MREKERLAAYRQHLGSLRQLAGVETLVDPHSGNRVIQLRNAAGLRVELAASRGLDIAACELRGVPLAWLSPAGRVPAEAVGPQDSWNTGFEGGLMVTCGLRQAGQPCGDGGEHFGAHGRVSYMPARITRCELVENGEPRFEVEGFVTEAVPLAYHLVLYRRITVPLFTPAIQVHDRVVNEGFAPAHHALLYHCNFGWPLVSPTARVRGFESTRTLIKGEADVADCLRVQPVGEREPDVILHTDIQNQGNEMTLRLENDLPPELYGPGRLTAWLRYSLAQCPYLTQWRHSGRGVNVFAFEPGSVSTRGRAWHRAEGSLPLLAPGGAREYALRFEFAIEPESPGKDGL